MSNNLKLEPEKLYYVKKQNGEICIRKTYLYSSIKTERYVLFVDFDDEDIIEVISPVPSYEELQAEINRLREEKSKIEIELKNMEQTCYGWQRLVESLEDQNNQLKAGNDKLREAINSALNFMACPDDLSELTGKCNDQAAFDVLREALNNESEG